MTIKIEMTMEQAKDVFHIMQAEQNRIGYQENKQKTKKAKSALQQARWQINDIEQIVKEAIRSNTEAECPECIYYEKATDMCKQGSEKKELDRRWEKTENEGERFLCRYMYRYNDDIPY